MNRILTALALLVFFTTSFAQDDPHILRLYEVYSYIDRLYVDSVPKKEISEAAIVAMLQELDPHSTYIPKDEVERANERIDGSFVGVGIRFDILKDTLLVVNPIPGGPSDKLGILAGDKIIEVDGEVIAGVGLKNSDVRKKLLGEKGSTVEVKVLRGREEPIAYTITRDKIPINSVVAEFMVDDKVGYIKLTSFSKTTEKEVDDAIKKLKRQGMKDLILDLQGNGGGLLYAAKHVSDQFLADDKMIVYSEGRTQRKSVLKADKKGRFEKGRVVILINESSASASEIVAGAIQDWDRGLIVGRRSFGKGLVQRPLALSDGAQLRLTIARYYTPSGRFIQKPYDNIDDYRMDYVNRFEHGEMMHRDSIHLPDSLIYKTLIKERDVYGGGGIMPDIFIPMDTSEYSKYYKDLSRSGVINTFALEYSNKNRKDLLKNYKNVDVFCNDFEMDQTLMNEFFEYAVGRDSTLAFVEEDYEVSGKLLRVRLKAMIAQNLWDYEAFYKIFNTENEIFMGALKALRDDTYEKLGL